ncbi:hypothetical protein [Bernardetia sp.]|uniref:hypothetical protein n=1 Tax=Bernardetia sp. TaxID=1937974 RepID=UPI0025B982BA|nr:hypothetical protein [Bernardetia sp.]
MGQLRSSLKAAFAPLLFLISFHNPNHISVKTTVATAKQSSAGRGVSCVRGNVFFISKLKSALRGI